MCGGGERTSSFFRTQDHVDGELPNGNILKHVQSASNYLGLQKDVITKTANKN